MNTALPDTKRYVRQLSFLFVVLFVALGANLAYLQIAAAPSITAQPGNSRYLLAQMTVPEGKIMSADGKVLADSRRRPGSHQFYRRVYPQGALTAHITGFASTKYGRTGLERSYARELSAQPPVLTWEDYVERMRRVRHPGNTLVTTIDVALQRAAMGALGRRRGAIVVMRPDTGDILALASYPSYDPGTVHRLWPKLRKDPASPLISRAAVGRYPPGSVFKVITAAGALDSEVATPDSIYEGPAELTVYGGKVINYADEGRGTMPLSEALALSVNTIFAQVGLDLGGARLVDYADRFGFNQDVPFDLPASRSTIPAAGRMDKLEVAWSAVGQGRVLVTPLGAALAASAIANRGSLMQPRVVAEVRDWRNNTVRLIEPREWSRPISAATALKMTDMMIGVVENGTGQSAAIDGVKVAGKTGTAEPGRGETHAWFVGFAPADDPKYAVSVVVEHGGLGGHTAAPLARRMLIQALGMDK